MIVPPPTGLEVPARRGPVRRSNARSALGLSAWTAIVLLGAGLTQWLNARGRGIGVDAPPLHAHFDVQLSSRLALVLVVGGTLVVVGPVLSVTLAWRPLLFAAPAAAALWSVTLAQVRGGHRLTSGLLSEHEYLRALPSIGSPRAFLGDFVDHIDEYPVHVEGHPPGFVLLLDLLDSVGLGGARVAAVLCILGAAAVVPAALLAVSAVAGEQRARRAAPFLVLAPAAIWAATSADGLFAGVSAWAVALVVLAIARPHGRGDAYALAGGLLFGVSAFLSYGLVLLGVVPIVVAVSRRRLRPILVAALGAVPVFVAFAALGFWWFDGLLATRERYFAGIASQRPYLVFLVANVSAFAIALGPAVGPALARLRPRGVWLLVGGGLLAVALADVSGMSKAEVERIWLPFVPWVLVATVALGRRAQIASRWLGAQVLFAVTIEVLIRTPW